MTLTVGSCFSGIGGLDLGLERAGMTVRWQSEIDPYCCRVLAKHWPHVPNLGDVTTIDWSTVEPVDLICGGYPCQPFSIAGKRAGADDHRHLWPWMLDAVRDLRPRYVLLENVAGHLSLGFGRVLGDLAEIGFDAEWDCVPAAGVGAPHRRDRVFIVAYPCGARLEGLWSTGPTRDRRSPLPDPDSGRLEGIEERDVRPEAWLKASRRDDAVGLRADVADTQGQPVRAGLRPSGERRIWRGRFGDCGCPGHTWSTEPDVGRVAHGVPHRVDRLRALGNAVVPQVAEHIGRLILAAHAEAVA